ETLEDQQGPPPGEPEGSLNEEAETLFDEDVSQILMTDGLTATATAVDPTSGIRTTVVIQLSRTGTANDDETASQSTGTNEADSDSGQATIGWHASASTTQTDANGNVIGTPVTNTSDAGDTESWNGPGNYAGSPADAIAKYATGSNSGGATGSGTGGST